MLAINLLSKENLRSFSASSFLLFALFFSTATKLRYAYLPIGLSEVFFALFGVFSYKQQKLNWGASRGVYFLLLFSFCLLSANLGAYLNSFQHNSLNSFLYDNFSLSYVMCITWLFLVYTGSMEIILKDLIIIKVCVATIFSFLSILGISEFIVVGRFSFLSVNPNQIALFLVPVPFFILYFYSKKDEIFYKSKTGIMTFILCFLLALLIRSFALLIAWTILFGALGVYYLKRYMQVNQTLFYSFISFITLFFISFCTWFFFSIEQFYASPIYLYIYTIPQEFYIRSEIWINLVTALINSNWIFGYGPGALTAVSPEHQLPLQEAHNIFLSMAYQGGAILFLIAIYGLYILSKRAIINGHIFLLFALLSLVIFSMFHSPIRMPILWFYLAYIYVSTLEKNDSSSDASNLPENKTKFISS